MTTPPNPIQNPSQTPDAQLRQALLGLAIDISTHHQPQPYSSVWLRAERRARQAAIARATRPLRIMSALGVAAALLATAFALTQDTTSRSSYFADIDKSLIAWTALAFLLLLAGCWAMFWADKASNHTIHHHNPSLL